VTWIIHRKRRSTSFLSSTSPHLIDAATAATVAVFNWNGPSASTQLVQLKQRFGRPCDGNSRHSDDVTVRATSSLTRNLLSSQTKSSIVAGTATVEGISGGDRLPSTAMMISNPYYGVNVGELAVENIPNIHRSQVRFIRFVHSEKKIFAISLFHCVFFGSVYCKAATGLESDFAGLRLD